MATEAIPMLEMGQEPAPPAPSPGVSNRNYFRTKNLPPLSCYARIKSSIRRFFRRITKAWWALEYSAAVVSILAMIGLVVLLTQADKRKETSYFIGNTQLTLNTLVAIIGTVLRTSLMLVVAGALNQCAWNWFAPLVNDSQYKGAPLEDLETFSEAAADSWSCIKLLWRTRCRQLASIGALVMILLLAFDAFLQQILSVEQLQQSDAEGVVDLTISNIIPHVKSLNLTELSLQSNGNNVPGINCDAFPLTQMLRGLTGTPEPNCPTGNCKWPVTPSIGICGECQIASPTITYSASDTCGVTTTYSFDDLWTSGYPDNRNPFQQVFSTSTSSCGDRSNDTFTIIIQGVPGNCSRFWGTEDICSSRSFPNYPTSFIDMLIYGSTNEQDGGFKAYECNLNFCLQGYQATTVAGNTSQTTLAEVSHKAEQMFARRGDPGNGWRFIDIPESLNVKAGSSFIIDEASRLGLAQCFQFFLRQSLTEVLQQSGSILSQDFTFLLFNATSSLAAMNTIIQNVADGLSSTFRATFPAGLDTNYVPTVDISVPTVIVRWPWLSYAIALHGLGLLFFVLTLRSTRRRHVRAWKAHRVPLLLANLDESLRKRAEGGLAYRTGLGDRVGEAQVRLEWDGHNDIVFRRVDQGVSRETRSSTVPPENQETGEVASPA